MKPKKRRTREEYARSESGAVRKRWNGRIRIALAYPNRYPVGMSNLGFQSVYRLFNAMDEVVCERAFLPEEGVHEIRTMESGSDPAVFDVIAFSVSFENDYIHIVDILQKAGLPPLAADRNSPHPLIVAGGVACFLNPEPIAPFIDCFLIGEAESLLANFIGAYDPGAPRRRALLRLAREVNGAYIPSFYQPRYADDGPLTSFEPVEDVPPVVKRQFPEDISELPACSAVLSPYGAFDAAYLIEVARGCPHGCRFCSAGFVYRPPRFRPLPLLEACVAEGCRLSDRIGLVGTAVSDLPDMEALCGLAVRQNARVSFSSLRTDALSDTMVSVLRQSRVKTATIAPDAGSERMRRVINKGISEEDVFNAVDRLVSGGIPNIKLYFMVGLPTETTEDVDAIVDLCQSIKDRFLERSRPRGRIGEIHVSLNAFVPKPFTPFQWAAMEEISSLKRKIRTVREALGRTPNMRVKTDPVRADAVQGILSRGDRRTSELLLTAHRYGGNWARTLKSHPRALPFYAGRERAPQEKLPWDFIDVGVKKSFLLKEYARALQAKASPPCPMEECTRCGVCGKSG